MLSISNPIKAGREKYYEERAQEEYYTRSPEELGQWFGRGAKFFGLEGPSTVAQFHNLLQGFTPDGRQPLVQNAGNPKRCEGWDLTFSAPKSVSVLWALAPDEVRAEILRAHHRAVSYTLTKIEDTLAVSRRGKAGAIHEKAGLVGVTQQHYASRDDDPQIHTHAVVINLGVRQDGSTGALHSINFFRAKTVSGAMYQARLAAELQQTLGVTIESRDVSFHIRGVPEAICDVFSKRSEEIKRVLNERGEKGALAAQKVTIETRPKKNNVPLDELLTNWRQEADAHGWGIEQAAKLIQLAREQRASNGLFQEEASRFNAAGEQTRPLNKHGQRDAASAMSQKLQEARCVNTAQSSDEARSHQQHESSDGKEHPRHGHASGTTESGPESQQSRTKENTKHNNSKQEQRSSAEQERTQREETGSQKQRQRRASSSAQPEGDTASERQRKTADKAFKKAFQEAVDRIFAEKQTRSRLTRLAFGLAARYGASEGALRDTLQNMRPGAERSFVHIEWRTAFRKAPWWSPVKHLKAPVIAVGERPRRWNNILWRKRLLFVELRIQNRRIFPRAPKWTGLRELELPALRLRRNSPQSPENQELKKHTMQHGH